MTINMNQANSPSCSSISRSKKVPFHLTTFLHHAPLSTQEEHFPELDPLVELLWVQGAHQAPDHVSQFLEIASSRSVGRTDQSQDLPLSSHVRGNPTAE
jgi:hypothetical protein